GPEKVARKFGHVVIFMDIRKTDRGKYSTRFIPLEDNPRQTKPNDITRLHVQTLEEIIRRRPEFWLWSHRRWKHSRGNK
ncbi:MAG: lipid A biosynthesis acyltransferase, partial [Bacteroidota bacterium]